MRSYTLLAALVLLLSLTDLPTRTAARATSPQKPELKPEPEPSSKSNPLLHTLDTLPPLTKGALTIVHTNDIHAHLQKFSPFGTRCLDRDVTANTCYGGIGRIQHTVNVLRNRNRDNTLFFDAGDQFQGTSFYTRFKGKVIAKAMNMMQYDLMTIGNHEFDDGPRYLGKFFSKLEFPVVCANTKFRGRHLQSLRNTVRPYHLFPEHKLAVVGYLTVNTPKISKSGPDVEFLDTVTSVQEAVDEVRALGYNKVIAVSHNGYKQDIEVAERTKGLSLIVGGHSHTYLSPDPNDPKSFGMYPTAVTGTDNQTTYVVQAKAWGEYVGYLDLTFNNGTGRIETINGSPIHMDRTVKVEPKIQDMLKPYQDELDLHGKRKLGVAVEDLDQRTCQYKECNIGDVIADSVLHTQFNSTDVDAAFVNAGIARNGIRYGDVLQEDIDNAIPFKNKLVVISLTGAKLRHMLEGIVSKENLDTGMHIFSFVQLSGLRMRFDMRKAIGQRIQSLDIRRRTYRQRLPVHPDSLEDFAPVEDEQVYRLATYDYLANGQDAFLAKPISNQTTLNILAAEALSRYFKAMGEVQSPRLNRLISVANKLVPRSFDDRQVRDDCQFVDSPSCRA